MIKKYKIRKAALRAISILMLLALTAAAAMYLQDTRMEALDFTNPPLEYGYSDDEMPKTAELADTEYEIYLMLRDADKKYEIDDDFIRFCAGDPNINSDGMFLSSCSEYLTRSGYDDEMWEAITGCTFSVLYDIYTEAAFTSPDILTVGDVYHKHKTTLAFAGDVNLSDGWYNMERYQSIVNGGGGIEEIFSDELLMLMRGADIFMLNNEFSISERGEPLEGKTYTFRASPQNLAIYFDIGADIVSLANNHVYDYGGDAFDDTLTYLDAAGIMRIGAGRDTDEAAKARFVISGGMKFGFCAASSAETAIFTPQATETDGGIMYMYDDAEFCEVIRGAAAMCDFVVAYVHFGTENSSEISDAQRQTAQRLIDSGADLVVGSHPHVLAPFEYYNGGLIAYSLGNFWFNTRTADTGLLTVSASVGVGATARFYPCIQSNGGVTLFDAGSGEGERIISEMNSQSQSAVIGDDNRIREREA